MRSGRGAARSVAAPFPARPWPPLAAARVAGPRPLPRAGASPRRLPPSLRVLVAPSARKGSFLRPLAALALRSASRPFALPLPSLARGSGALWGVLAPRRLGLALPRAGSPVPPCPAPCGGSRAPAPPGGAPAGRGLRRAFWCLRRPPGVGVGAAAAAAAARRRPSVSLPGACFRVSRRCRGGGAARMLFRERRMDKGEVMSEHDTPRHSTICIRDFFA